MVRTYLLGVNMKNITKTKKVTITLPKELVLQAKNRVFEEGKTLSGLIRTQIKGYLENEP